MEGGEAADAQPLDPRRLTLVLQAVKQLLELPLNLTVVSPAHTPNWDLVSDVVNSCSRIYRSSKQCRNRYENVLIPREEGKVRPPSCGARGSARGREGCGVLGAALSWGRHSPSPRSRRPESLRRDLARQRASALLRHLEDSVCCLWPGAVLALRPPSRVGCVDGHGSVLLASSKEGLSLPPASCITVLSRGLGHCSGLTGARRSGPSRGHKRL